MPRRPCILLYGFLGATPRQLHVYERLLANPERRVVGHIMPAGVFFRRRATIEEQARRLADAALEATANAHRCGLFALSGNGSTTVSLLLRELRTRRERGDPAAARLLERLGAVVYDSAPIEVAPPVLATGFLSMAAAQLRLDPSWPARAPGLLRAAEGAFGALISLGDRRSLCSELYEGLRMPVPHLLCFSRADAVIPAREILSFAAAQQQLAPVRLEEFEGSAHVEHYRRFPDRYKAAVDDFLGETMHAKGCNL